MASRVLAKQLNLLEPAGHLIVGAGPCRHFHSVYNLLDIHHLKDGKGVPDRDPDVANDCEVDILPGIGGDPSKDTCSRKASAS